MAQVRKGRFFTTLRRNYPNGKWTLYVTPRASDHWFSISFDGRRPVSVEGNAPVPADNLLP
jgi:hypothetical protein